MPRIWEIWTCVCGHSVEKVLSVSKTGQGVLPIAPRERRARCRKCRRRGACRITHEEIPPIRKWQRSPTSEHNPAHDARKADA
jgi:hypothetical protein